MELCYRAVPALTLKAFENVFFAVLIKQYFQMYMLGLTVFALIPEACSPEKMLVVFVKFIIPVLIAADLSEFYGLNAVKPCRIQSFL